MYCGFAMAMFSRTSVTSCGPPVTPAATALPESSGSDDDNDDKNSGQPTGDTSAPGGLHTKKQRRTGKRRRKGSRSGSSGGGTARPHTASGRRSARPGSRARKASGHRPASCGGEDQGTAKLETEESYDSSSLPAPPTAVSVYSSLSRRHLIHRVNAATSYPSTPAPVSTPRKQSDNLIVPTYRPASVEPSRAEQYSKLSVSESYQHSRAEQTALTRPSSRLGSTQEQGGQGKVTNGQPTQTSQYRANNGQQSDQSQGSQYRSQDSQEYTGNSQYRLSNGYHGDQRPSTQYRLVNAQPGQQTQASQNKISNGQQRGDQQQPNQYRLANAQPSQQTHANQSKTTNGQQSGDQKQPSQYRLSRGQQSSQTINDTSSHGRPTTANRAPVQSAKGYTRPYSSYHSTSVTSVHSIAPGGDKTEVHQSTSSSANGIVNGSSHVPLRYSSIRGNLISARPPASTAFTRQSQRPADTSASPQRTAHQSEGAATSSTEDRKPITLRTLPANGFSGAKNNRCYPVVTPSLVQETRTGLPPHHEPLLSRAKTWSWTSLNGSLSELGAGRTKATSQRANVSVGEAVVSQEDLELRSILKMRDHSSRGAKKNVRFSVPELDT